MNSRMTDYSQGRKDAFDIADAEIKALRAALADAERRAEGMREALEAVAEIAHFGGLQGLSETAAMTQVRKLSQTWMRVQRVTAPASKPAPCPCCGRVADLSASEVCAECQKAFDAANARGLDGKTAPCPECGHDKAKTIQGSLYCVACGSPMGYPDDSRSSPDQREES